MTDLPPGWAWTTLGEVAHVASNLKSPLDYPDLPHIAPNHIESRTGRLFPFHSVCQDGVTSPKHLFFTGQILYSKIRPYLAKVVLAPTNGLCSADMYPITTELHPPYLLRWMLSDEFTELVSAHQGRSLLPKINARALAGLPVPVAPLPEQRRIVDELDALMSRVVAARKGINSTTRKIETLRTAIRTQLLLSRPTRPTSLAQIIGDVQAGRSNGSAAPPASLDEWGVVKVSAMTWGNFRSEENKRVEPHSVDPRFEISPGDLLVSRANTVNYVGAPVLVEEVRPRLLLSDKSLRLVPQEGIHRRWLLHSLASAKFRSYVSRTATGTKDSMRNISQSALLAGPIDLPSVEDQREIAVMIDDALDEQVRLSQAVERSTERARVLSATVLTQAFRGELTRQDSADEPASVLLERIRTNSATTAPARPTQSHRPHRSVP